ncbi:MAG: hypothetical protein ACRD92_03810 [Nitrosopumilaceae archaeon]
MFQNFYKINLSVLILFSSLFVIAPVFAEEQALGAVLVQTDPYYFSEGDLGIKILKFFQLPLDPYLVPGKTTEQSTIQEISEAYNEAAKVSGQKAIVDDDSRATVFVVDFSGGDLTKTYRFNSFSKFTHIAKTNRGDVPYYYQNVSYGLELESLPSEDKKIFYDNLVATSINAGKKPEPFDISITIMTGDGYTLQVWQYQKCTILSYTPYLDEILVKLKFVGDFVSEIRDKTEFSCDGFSQDFELKEPVAKNESILVPTVPEKENRAERIIVQFSGGELTSASTFYSFSKFVPLVKVPNDVPISIPGNVIGEKPRFALESLPTKDKQSYYQNLSKYVNPEKPPEPFDVTIHLVTGGGKILQSWKYTDCSANSYVTFFLDNLLSYKFKQTVGSEIRDKTFFECNGLLFNPDIDLTKIDTKQTFVSDDSTRAQTFAVHFQGTDISPERTVASFTKFSPITYEETALLLPNAPFGKAPKFYLESLPNKDNQWYYQLMSKYINAGKIPELFDATVDVLVGDGTKIQSWKYTDCEVLEYKTYLEDSLFLRKFTNKFEKEFRDRTIFQCIGLSIDGNSYPPEKTPDKTLDYVDFIPSEESRIKTVTATFSGGELTEPFTINTFGKFSPKIEQRSQTERQFVRFDVTLIPTGEAGPESPSCGPEAETIDCVPPDDVPPDPTFTFSVTMPHISKTQKNDYITSTEFTITSLPSKDKMQYYDIVSRYINPGKTPEPFDVTFDYQSEDGTIVQSWKYGDCQITDLNIKLQDTLLYFSLSNVPGAADIVDSSTFRCNGFSVDFDQKKSTHQDAVIPSPYDRAMLNLVHWYGGELTNQRSSALVQKVQTFGASNVLVGGLPNIYHKDVYQFVSRYLNPGKPPEPLDMRFDTVTGDGTILFSTIYSDCTVKDASTYLSDNMAIIRYVPGLKSEIRGQSSLFCAGTAFKTIPQKDTLFDPAGNLRKISPIVQGKIGVPGEKVICKEGYDLMIRPPKNIPVCVKTDDIQEFEKRGWNHPTQTEKKNLVDILGPILPTQNERATSFAVSFEGTYISPPKTVETFSKFSPIKNTNSVFLRPSNPLDSSSKAFYLESLPSKDKAWFYELASRYVNPGVKPELFNVGVEVKDGNGEMLQLWKYSDCEIADFVSYYDDNLLAYKFHGKWQSEMRDRSLFSCASLTINN